MLPRWRKIPHNPDYFTVTNIVEEVCYMIKVLRGAWWVASYGSYKRPPEHREVIQHLRMKGKLYADPGAAMHYMDNESLGYLFKIVTAMGKRFKVTFDTLGFTFGTSAHFSEITSVLSYISMVEKVTFATRPCPAMQANPSVGDEDMEGPPRVTESPRSL